MKQGIIMEIQARDAFVFTNECCLIRVPARKDMFVGQSIQLAETAVLPASRRRWLLPALAAACLVLLLSTGFLFSILFLPQAGPVYLSLDINPSIEFTLNAERQVTDVMPLNSDAWELLAKTKLTGLGYEEAIARWIALVRENKPGQLDNLLISAVISRRDRSFADQIMGLAGPQASQRLSALAGLDVQVLFSTDPAIKTEADANGLSIGRQMLLNRARERKMDLDVETIRTTALGYLLQCLPDETTPGQTADTLPDSSETSGTGETAPENSTETTAAEATTGTITETATEPAATTSEETTSVPSQETTQPTTQAASQETTRETTRETSKETTRETAKETTRETTKETTQPLQNSLVLKAAVGETGWKLNWSLSPSGKSLAYYKVVISKSDSTPKYPDQGYLFAIGDRSSNQCLVDNSSPYNGGDFNGYLVKGQPYYVSITYVLNDEPKMYSNVLKLTYNGPVHETPVTEPTAAFSPILEATSDAEGFHLVWTVSPADRVLNYYKVVISQSDSTPMYPDNGYLYALGRNDNRCRADNSGSYNGGDVGESGGWLIVGQKYYVAITYVFDGLKVSSNVVALTYGGPA